MHRMTVALEIAVWRLFVGRQRIDLLSVLSSDMTEMGWAGPFNRDLMRMLLLSALSMVWRHRFGTAGPALCLLTRTPPRMSQRT